MDAPRLRSLLLRGSLIAAANWPVVVAQGISESVVRALAGIPVAGAAMLLLLVSVPNASPGPAIDSAAAALTALATVPAALAGVAVSAIVAALGAIAFGAVIKAGSVAVIVAGEARARAAPAGPLRVPALSAAQAWSRARFTDGCARFGPRFVRLGLVLAVLEAGVALGYATAVVQAYRTFVSVAASWWIAPAVVAVSVIALALSIVAELGYRLTQLVVVADDCGLRAAMRGASGFMRRDTLVVARVCVAALAAVGADVRDRAGGGGRLRPRLVRAGGRRRGAAAAGGGLGRPRPDAAVHRSGGAGGVCVGVPGVAGGGVAGAVGDGVAGAAGAAGIPGGGAGTVTGVPGSTVIGRGGRIEEAPRGVHEAVLRHQHQQVVEDRGARGEHRPGRQRLERMPPASAGSGIAVEALALARLPIDARGSSGRSP